MAHLEALAKGEAAEPDRIVRARVPRLPRVVVTPGGVSAAEEAQAGRVDAEVARAWEEAAEVRASRSLSSIPGSRSRAASSRRAPVRRAAREPRVARARPAVALAESAGVDREAQEAAVVVAAAGREASPRESCGTALPPRSTDSPSRARRALPASRSAPRAAAACQAGEELQVMAAIPAPSAKWRQLAKTVLPAR